MALLHRLARSPRSRTEASQEGVLVAFWLYNGPGISIWDAGIQRGHMPDRQTPLNTRSLLDYLWRRLGENRAMAIFAPVSGSISIASITFLAYLTDTGLVFPALGPTIFLIFSRPMSPAASPRNVVLGHLMGCVCGWVSLSAVELLGVQTVFTDKVNYAHVLSVALSLGLTTGLLILLRLEHPPAASTTLIVSLGFLSSIPDLAILMAAVVIVAAQAIVMNNHAGFPYPLWRPAQDWQASQYRPSAPVRRRNSFR